MYVCELTRCIDWVGGMCMKMCQFPSQVVICRLRLLTMTCCCRYVWSCRCLYEWMNECMSGPVHRFIQNSLY